MGDNNSNSKSNIDYVLGALGQTVISGGSGYQGFSLSVGIYDQTARKALRDVIIDAIQNKDEKINEKYDDIKNTLGQGLKTNNEQSKQNIEKLIKAWQAPKSFFTKFTEGFYNLGEKLPGFLKIFNGLIYAGGKLLKLQFSSIANFNKLNNSGIALEESTTQLYGKASKIGITIDDLVKSLQDNSQRLVKMRSIFGNGLESFTSISEKVKQTSKEIGLSYSTGLKASMNYFDSVSTSYFILGKDLGSLQTESERYIKSLQKLSLATGKSTESILAEIEAREKDSKWKIISSDEKNKEIITAMTAMGFSNDDIMSVITGQMQESTAISASTNSAMAEMIDMLQQLKLSGKKLSSEEIFKYVKENLSEGSKLDSASIYKLLQENPSLVNALQEDQLRGAVLSMDIQQMNSLESNENDLKKSSQLEEIRENAYKTWNKFLQAFSVEGEGMTKLMESINILFKKFNEEVLTDELINKIGTKLNDFLNGGIDFLVNNTENLFKNLGEFIDKAKILFDDITKIINFIKDHATIISVALGSIAALFVGYKFKAIASSLSLFKKVIPLIGKAFPLIFNGLKSILPLLGPISAGIIAFGTGAVLGKTAVDKIDEKWGTFSAIGDMTYNLSKKLGFNENPDVSNLSKEEIQERFNKLKEMEKEKEINHPIEQIKNNEKEKIEKTTIKNNVKEETKSNENNENNKNNVKEETKSNENNEKEGTKSNENVLSLLNSINSSVSSLVKITSNIKSDISDTNFSNEVAIQSF